MKKTLYICLVFILSSMTSCYKDEGNYDYTELNDIYVSLEESGTVFYVDRYDTLRLSPRLSFSQQPISDDNLEFKWELYLDDWAASEAQATLLSTEKNLVAQISKPESSNLYALVLSVKNKLNGAEYRFNYHVSVQPSVLSGLMVLQDDHGKARLDYLASTYAEPTFGTNHHIADVISSANDGMTISGNPRGVLFTLATSASYLPQVKRVYMWTDEHVVLLDANDFTLSYTDYDLFEVQPDRLDVQNMKAGGSNSFLINHGQVHNISQQASFSWGYQFSRPLKPGPSISGEVEVEPYIYLPDDFSSSTGFAAVLYDKLGRRFVRVDYDYIASEPPLKSFDPQNDAAKKFFDVNNVGKDMVWMGKGNAGQCFAVMTDGTTREIYRCRFNIAATITDDEGNVEINPQVYNVAMGIYDLSAAEGGNDARYFDCSRYSNVLIYANDRNAYVYDFSARKATRINDDFPEGEQITAMKIYNVAYSIGNLSNVSGTLLYIATWNGTEGKVYEFPINRTTGRLNNRDSENLNEPYNVFTGFGKVVSMDVKCQGRSE